ncbi:hypothetical protein JCM33374_g6311 [Metschnikowia sp. JCM 33374]|nr:hypothetical protein JCM33374_g6311 [Metschnikowia sp. JCM 33374]
MDRSYQLDTSAPENVMAADYQLALKIFMNKDIARSFGMVRKLQPAVFRSFCRGFVSEPLFSKITTLYLTEVGLLLKPEEAGETLPIPQNEKEALANSLKTNVIFDQISHIYGSVADAPSELIFHLFLVYYTCRHEIDTEKTSFVLDKFISTYHQLEFQRREKDRHLKRWFDMFVLNVLPDAGDFATAFAIADANPSFGGSDTVSKLKEVQDVKNKEILAAQKKKNDVQAQEAKRLAAEKEQHKKETDEKSLKYRTLKQIQADQESRGSSRGTSVSKESSVSPPTLDRVRERLLHYYSISKSILQNNSPVILAVIVLVFIGGKFARARKVNLKQKLRDTLSMAFKVTYV